MLILSVGFPNSFTSLCQSLILNLARRARGSSELISADTPEELGSQIVSAEASTLVVAVRRPSPRLQQLLIQSESRFVLALSDPCSVVVEMLQAQNVELIDAVRAVANSTASVMRCARSEGALTLFHREGQSILDLAKALDRHFGFNLGARELRAASRETTVDERDLERPQNGFDPQEEALIGGALDGFLDYAATGQIGQITWERSLFFFGDAIGRPATQAVQMAGLSRCLLYGPYIALPPGAWTAHVILACSASAVGMDLAVEITSGHTVLARSRLPLERAGVTDAALDFIVAEAVETAIEIRIFNERATLGGQIGLGRVILVPRPSIQRGSWDDIIGELNFDHDNVAAE